MSAPSTLLTPRLVLRMPRMDDAASLYAGYVRDEEVTRYLSWKTHTSPDETTAFLRRVLKGWRTGAEYTWAVTLRGELIGMIGARVSGALVNLGYVLARPFWNKGYMTEAVTAVSSWALNEEGVFRVWAVCDVDNAASARVLEKAGFVREGILRRWIVLPNLGQEPRDCVCFAMVR